MIPTKGAQPRLGDGVMGCAQDTSHSIMFSHLVDHRSLTAHVFTNFRRNREVTKTTLVNRFRIFLGAPPGTTIPYDAAWTCRYSPKTLY